MGSEVQELNVHDSVELENSVLSYIAQGFVVQNRTDDTVTMFKKKEFNVLWAIIGFFLCWIPLIIYAIMYSQETDKMVVIRIGHGNAAITWTADHNWWSSDGSTWRDASLEMPDGAQLSEDGHYWWDGTTWNLVPTGQAAVSAPPPAADPAPAPVADPVVDTVVEQPPPPSSALAADETQPSPPTGTDGTETTES